MVTDSLKQEINEFVEDKQALLAERVAYKTAVTEHAEILNKFVTENLASEMGEFRADRGTQAQTMGFVCSSVWRHSTRNPELLH